MSSPSNFLRLPRELRDLIYQYYVLEYDGYHYEYESGKFRTSNHRPINLALMYTCKAIAAEMYGVALGSNIITFSTACTKSLSKRADFLNTQHPLLSRKRRWYVATIARACVTPEIKAKVAREYPQMLPLLEVYIEMGNDVCETEISWGESGSLNRRFVNYLAQLFLESPRYKEARTVIPEVWGDEFDWTDDDFITGADLPPWAFPTNYECQQLKHMIRFYLRSPSFFKNLRWHVSAASIATDFLKRTAQSTCRQIRNILLNEDNISVAHPECHALGLIKFCLENQRLHIERRVNLWRSVFLGGSMFPSRRFSEPAYENIHYHGESLRSDNISSSLNTWIMEALFLVRAGMPTASFSLVFDGSSTSDQSSEALEVAKEDAAWQVALDQWYAEKSEPPSYYERRHNVCYQSDAFPQVIQDMVAGTSFIRCNFPIGGSWDPQYIYKRNRDCTLEDWQENWKKERETQRFSTVAPLPPWTTLLKEVGIPIPPVQGFHYHEIIELLQTYDLDRLFDEIQD